MFFYVLIASVGSTKTMGFEIETSAFKVIDGGTTLLKSDSDTWEFTTDTADSSVPGHSNSLLNIEAKTIGGLDLTGIKRAAEEVSRVWQVFGQESMKKSEKQKTMEIEVRYINTVLRDLKKIYDSIKTQKTACVERLKTIEDEEIKNRLSTEYMSIFDKIITSYHDETEKLTKKTDRLIQEALFTVTSEQFQNSSFTVSIREGLTILKPNCRSDQMEKSCQPQITYRLPLSKIEDLLIHLAQKLNRQQEPPNTQFCRFLSNVFPYVLSDTKSSLTTTKFTEKLQKKTTYARLMEITLPCPNSNSKEEQEMSSARGLALLFLLYAYSLFWEPHSLEQEPGPKPYLGIMSRIPFSSMYDNFEEKGKEEFLKFIRNMASTLPDLFGKEIQSYTTPPGQSKRKITLAQWAESIINKNERKNGKDLLSPPSGCSDDYSMGLYTPINPGQKSPDQLGKHEVFLGKTDTLIEVRAYSKLKDGNNKNFTLDSFSQLMDAEADWFFGLGEV